MTQFWNELRLENIDYHSDEKLESCVGSFKRKIFGRIYPKNSDEVQKIVLISRKHKIPLHPISSGKNWGLGSHLPTSESAVIVDLKSLKGISNFSNEFGFVTIEAGVTQKELSEYLISKKSDWFIDVTGSASSTTIIGNSMERGMAYNSIRVDTTGPMEIVLGTGEIYKTGFLPYTKEDISHLYRHGIGPSLDGLFFQSNFGIVTKATIYLLKKSEIHIPFILKLKSIEDVLSAIQSIRSLLQDGVLNCVPHIFDKNRLHPGLCSLLHLHLNAEKIKYSKDEITKLVEKEFPTEWLCTGNIRGSKKEVELKSKILNQKLKNIGNLLIITPRIQKISTILSRLPFFKTKNIILKAQDPIKNLVLGVPTDYTMPSVQWPILGTDTKLKEAIDPDTGIAGVVFTSPVTPLNSKYVAKTYEITKQIAKKYNFEVGITFNCISHRILEAVVSLHFNRQNLERAKSAQECIQEMNQEYIKNGILPYRLSINQMDIYSHSQNNVLSELKKIFDPDKIISVGRYNIN